MRKKEGKGTGNVFVLVRGGRKREADTLKSERSIRSRKRKKVKEMGGALLSNGKQEGKGGKKKEPVVSLLLRKGEKKKLLSGKKRKRKEGVSLNTLLWVEKKRELPIDQIGGGKSVIVCLYD